jgi:hypothetical protein
VRNGLDEGGEVCDRKGLVDKREDKRDGDKRGGGKEDGHERLTRLI